MDRCRRILALLLAAAMLLSLAACARNGQTEPVENGTAVQSQETLAASLQAPAMNTAEDQTPVQTQPAPSDMEGTQPAETVPAQTEAQQVAATLPVDDSDRESLEQIVDLLVKDAVPEEEVSQMDDAQLEQLVTDLLEQGGSTEVIPSDQPFVELEEDAYDEEGAMQQPFDQVYPELIQQGKVEYDEQTLLIKLESDTITDGMAAAGVAALEAIVPMEGAAWYEAKLYSGTDAMAAVEALRALEEVLLVEYNYQIQTASIDHYKPYPGDKDLGGNKHEKDQWHMHHCGIPDGMGAMQTAGGSESVIVAVIDTGVDYDHEDLADNIWTNPKEIPDNGIDDDANGYVDDYYGVNIVTGSGNGDDDNGHGTHVAGIIAAQNNHLGTVGVAYNVTIMPIKAAMASGYLHQSDIAKAVYYAYEHGAEVINMSFGGTACSIAVQDALAIAYTRCVLVASAGNDGAPNEPINNLPPIPNYPAALSYVLGVMSVDSNGVESSFSNFDAFGFNGIEYELYAPGDAIMSTLPDNRYGFLSGTSMAAPVVAAMAAILRSEFTDRDKYPTKFIYGQLAATSDYTATCLDPKMHGKHNLPQIVNLHAALTKLPTPDVNLQDYALFDTEGFAQDTAGKNNGDGAIDAGETIALGLTLRNRWGMSEHTMVHLDTLSLAGIADPYITILNDTVDYGSVGTYSTQDCGRIYTDELLTGWEDPFYIHIAEDCPNDYIFRLNVTVTCGNALNAEDTGAYTNTSTILLEVRNGTVLPKIISEDMVLTPENLYIIPDSTIIEKGATVRVEPGTHIQFWSNDREDPYADNYIAYLRVEGQFLVEGTRENPVYIYPSDLMDHYIVEIGTAEQGVVSLNYAQVTNLCYTNANIHGMITSAYGCTFRNNYGTDMGYRQLDQGVVWDGRCGIAYSFGHVENSAFYKIGGIGQAAYVQNGEFERCIFVDSGISFGGNVYRKCVFLGNCFQDQTEPDYVANSSQTLDALYYYGISEHEVSLLYRPETGTTYVQIALQNIDGERLELRRDTLREYFRELGGDAIVMETEEERNWLIENLCFFDRYYPDPANIGHYYNSYNFYDLSISYDYARGSFVWMDGSKVETVEVPEDWGSEPEYFYRGEIMQMHEHPGHQGESHYDEKYLLYEIPGPVYLTDMRLPEYEILLDMGTTHQLTVSTQPIQVEPEALFYESRDETVVTVDESGSITPVGLGTADVYIYSDDRALSTYVTVEVRDYVALEALTLPYEYAEVAVGETLSAACTLQPADTTRRNVTYASSDPAIATVDRYGTVKGISSGEVTITVSSAEVDGEGNPISAEMTVKVYNQAASLEIGTVALLGTFTEGVDEGMEGVNVLTLPEVLSSDNAEMNLSWRSVDTSVADIEGDKLVLKKLGTTTLEVTDSRSGLKASCPVIIQAEAPAAVRKMVVEGQYHFVLLEDDRMYFWSANYPTPLCAERVKDFVQIGEGALILLEDGTLIHWYARYDDNIVTTDFVGRKVTDLAIYNSAYFCIADGNAYAWGSDNQYGELGVGFAGKVDTPTLINLDNVVDITAAHNTSYFLTAEGNLYYSGYYGTYNVAEPTLLAQNIDRMLENTAESSSLYAVTKDGTIVYCSITYGPSVISINTLASQLDRVAYTDEDLLVGILDGRVYQFGSATEMLPEPVPGINNAVNVYAQGKTCYVMTEDNLLLAFGDNPVSSNHMLGMSPDSYVEYPVILPIQGLAEETVSVTATNLTDHNTVLYEDELVLTFNKHLKTAGLQLYKNGAQVTVNYRIEDLNKLVITRSSGFEDETDYKVVIPAGSLTAEAGVTNTEQIVLEFRFFDMGSNEEEGEQEIIPNGPVIHPAVLDETADRFYWTAADIAEQITKLHEELNLNVNFLDNVLLNRLSTDTEVSHWLRILSPEKQYSNSGDIPLGRNYWGTTNERAIGLQILDYSDYPTYVKLLHTPYLTEAPEDTFPFVTGVQIINKDGEAITTVGNEEVTFRVTFNRDMDTSIPLRFRFGSAYPFGDYEVFGAYVDARTWEGTYLLTTVIENGYQYFQIAEGCTADGELDLWSDTARFFFELDTTAAQALIMQGAATDTGIELKWTQDDFDTLMGYNVYRSTSEDGYYQRINSTVIPAETKEFFDDTVEPGVVYYYNFTVVKTDLTESIPSGKIIVMSKDTMAPDIYHAPVATATTGSNLIVSATVTDNLTIHTAKLYYRTVGQTQWNTAVMNNLNDKYSAIIPAAQITLDGLEYYLEAFDGHSYTYKGSAENPYRITVRQTMDDQSRGDVNGDGAVSNLDALMLLQAINDLLNLTAEQFERADLNGDGRLVPAEALRILQYVSGSVGSLAMQ